jgi:hypothetical protein
MPDYLELKQKPKQCFVSQDNMIKLLRESCEQGGGSNTFDYEPKRVGTHSFAQALPCHSSRLTNQLSKHDPQQMELLRLYVLHPSPGSRHAFLSGNANKPTQLNPAIQCNVDAATDSPEDLIINGQVTTAQFTASMHVDT